MDTINKLLKKPAPKRRTRAEIIAAQHAADNTPYEDEGDVPPANPLFVRYVRSKNGARLGVPVEWLDKDQPVGEVLRNGWAGPKPRGGGAGQSTKLVEEVA